MVLTLISIQKALRIALSLWQLETGIACPGSRESRLRLVWRPCNPTAVQ